MWPLSSLLLPSVPDSWGEVHARDRIIRYRRLGIGQPGSHTLVLLGDERSDDLWPELPSLLATDHRLIIPELASGEDAVSDRLNCMVEGLGVSAVGLVAGGRFALPALELALGVSDAVGRLVLVGPANDADEQGALSARTSAVAIPLLVLPRRFTAPEAHLHLRRFLEWHAAHPF